jgi:diguanylate cyclase (GGDEF)-like protein
LSQVAASTNSTNAAEPEFQGLLAQVIYENSPDGILVVDAHGTVVSHNPQFIKVWNIATNQLHTGADGTAIGESDAPLLAEVVSRVKNPGAFLDRIRELYNDPQLNDHCEIELKDGRYLERHSTVLRRQDGHYLGRVWFIRDVTVQKNHEAALIQLARHDPLTGAANRRYFFERANEEFMRSRRYQHALSVNLIDVDHFKKINDQHGHAAGDEVLKHLSQNIRSMLRDADLFARIGGEEFAILMPNTDLVGAQQLTERLRQVTMEKVLPCGDQQLHIRFSAGVTQLKAADLSIEDCIRRADGAMYHAKNNGRNRVEAVV